MSFRKGFRAKFLAEGDHRGVDPSLYDKRQLAMGMKEEKEHSPDPKVREKISKDHLAKQIKEKKPQNYYTGLNKAEL
jgi:hypothetical protein